MTEDIILSEQEYKAFLRAILNPTTPTEKAIKTAQKYRKLCQTPTSLHNNAQQRPTVSNTAPVDQAVFLPPVLAALVSALRRRDPILADLKATTTVERLDLGCGGLSKP